jgi:hypothetical protein
MAGARGCSLPRTDLLSSAARTHVVPWALVVLRALIAIAIAAGVTAQISGRLSRSLEVSTDVVGYPIFGNFNVDRYLWVYALWVAFFPLAALAIDLGLSRLTRGRFPRATSIRAAPPDPGRTPSTYEVEAVGLIRTAFVGLVVGLEVSIGSSLEGYGFLLATLGVLVLYGAVAAAVASFSAGLRGGRLSFAERLATVNIFASTLTVLGLHDVSEATRMRVLATGNVYEYPWFPLWLAAALTALLLAVAVLAARRALRSGLLRTLERRFLLLVPASVLLVLVLARLPGEIGPIDFFHEGEPLAAGRLTADGAFPWRDLMFIHGLLHDVFNPLVGFTVFEDSRWGGFAGATVIIFPFYWLGQYFLSVYLFGRNVLFLLGTQVVVVLGLIRDVHIRFALMPFALLLLAAVLRRPTWPRTAALAGVLAAQAVLSPETTIVIPACLAVLGLYELSSYDRSVAFYANFQRTLRTLAAGVLFLSLFCGVLAGLGVLDDFLFFYRTFASEHTLTGGIPIKWIDTRFYVAAIAPVVLVILAIWFFATARRVRRSPAIDDWVMAALAITVALYYPKFLARADTHVYQAFAVATPLLAYAIYRVVSLLEDYTARRPIRFARVTVPTRYWITAVALVVVTMGSTNSVLDTAGAVPDRLSAQAHLEPVPDLGYLSPNATDLNIFSDLTKIFDAYLEPDDHVFDFSNNPMLFHYLLERRPSTRYFHVSMAIRQNTQSDLVQQLERRKPKLVVFSSNPYLGLPSWDSISNPVRHYDVSEYLLDHYRPLLASHDYILMGRNGAELRPAAALDAQLAETPITDQLYFRALPCDWGYAPNFLSTRPDPHKSLMPVELRYRPSEGVATVNGWAADLDAKAPAVEVVAALGPRVVARVEPSIDRPEIAGGLGDEGFLLSGFTMQIPGSVPLHELRFYGLTRAGEARELIYGPDSGLAPTSGKPNRLTVDQRSFRVLSEGIHGWAERATGAKKTLELELPRQAIARDYDWFEIRTRSRFAEDTFGITDVRAESARTISFKTLDRGRTAVKVQVGACSQWHGFQGDRLYLESLGDQEISGIRLIP